MKRVRWIAGVGLLLPTAACLLFHVIGGLYERGTTVCMVCASARDETLLCGIPLRARPAVPREATLERYERWFERNVATPHTHARRRIGCWAAGPRRVECFKFWGEPFYGVVPDLSDQELAKELAERMLGASRREMLRVLEGCERVRCGTIEEPIAVDLPAEMVERLAAYGLH